jgi:galactokinase
MRAVLERVFGPGGRIVVGWAPGRVNLIGEHTDYNDGFVLPMAIGMGIAVAGRRSEVDRIRIHAADLGETATFPVAGAWRKDPAHPWSDYLRGVLQVLDEREGVPRGGMDLAFGGDVPQGAGLSSSAALEVATALVALALGGRTLPTPRIARLCQEAENAFVGMQCGIMDMFVSVAARAGHALLLDCRSLEAEQVPLEVGSRVVAICHSGVKHELVASEYNTRRAQCRAGVEALRARFPEIAALRDATRARLEACRDALPDEVYRRCRHVIAEDDRVQESVAALRGGDLARFGALMNASHDSLRDDYEVSCPEVDRLVELARAVPGVLGARITGGGFGGCTVNLVEEAALDAFRSQVLAPYQRETGRAPRLFVSTPAGGARVVEQGSP